MKVEIRKECVFNFLDNEVVTKYVCYLVAEQEVDGIDFNVRIDESEYSDIEKAIEYTTEDINRFIAKHSEIEIEQIDLYIDEDEIIQYEIEVPERAKIL